jgi:hypothetical protein
MNDPLERAARVVRDRHGGESSDAEATLRRVVQRSRGVGHRRRRVHLIVAPLLAALVASVAWGASTGRLSSFVNTLASQLERRSTNGDSGDGRPRSSRSDGVSVPLAGESRPQPSRGVEATATESTSVVVEAPPAAAASVERPRSTPSPVLPVKPRASTAVAPSPVPSAAPVDPDSLYRAAHRAQFEARDYAAAAAAWERYLEAAPNGTFAPEARWSRAIALVRLGRNAEAANALEPFARGDYGPYRRDEARSLLATLKK